MSERLGTAASSGVHVDLQDLSCRYSARFGRFGPTARDIRQTVNPFLSFCGGQLGQHDVGPIVSEHTLESVRITDTEFGRNAFTVLGSKLGQNDRTGSQPSDRIGAYVVGLPTRRA